MKKKINFLFSFHNIRLKNYLTINPNIHELLDENKLFNDLKEINEKLKIFVAPVWKLINEIGHTKKWQSIFDELLDKAQDLGIYDKNIPMQSNYCGYN